MTLRTKLQRKLAKSNKVAEVRQAFDELLEVSSKLELTGLAQVLPSLTDSFERTLKCFRKCEKRASLESLHDLRKLVKQLYYQLEVISRHNGAFGRGLKQLGTDLGKFRDVSLLRESVSKSKHRRGSEKICEALDQQTKRLVSKGLAFAGKVFKYSPEKWAGA
jgi:CHAD domain-containing protein